MDFAAAFFNEALRSPNHKTCFSFALGCIQNLHFPIHFCPFSPVSTQQHQNGRAWCKSCVHLRAKLKHVLWLEDLKASLKNAAEKSFHKTSSNIYALVLFRVFRQSFIYVYIYCIYYCITYILYICNNDVVGCFLKIFVKLLFLTINT